MNFKNNYFTASLLLVTSLIFLGCSNDNLPNSNSDLNLIQGKKQESKTRALFKKYGWSVTDKKELEAKGFDTDTTSVFRYKNIEELEKSLKEIDEILGDSFISDEEFKKAIKSDEMIYPIDNKK